jgi:NitT/TauT family transport system substrate-binding protein
MHEIAPACRPVGIEQKEVRMKLGSTVAGSIGAAASLAALLLLVFAFDLACAQQAAATDLTPLRFRQSFIPSESFIPEQVAIDKKFYEAMGLNVEMLRSTGGGNAASLVGAGDDPVGVAGASDVLIARNKGLDIIAIGVNMPTDPSAIIGLSSNPIRSIAELHGKRIGVIPGSTAFALLQALLKSNNLSEQDVKLVLIGAGDLISGVLTGRLDAIAAFETTNVPAFRAAGADPVSLRFRDLGLRVPGNVYVANGEFARSHSDTVARFMAGTIRGWQQVNQDGGKEGLPLLLKAYPELASQKALVTQRWEFRVQNDYNPYRNGQPLTIDDFKFDPRTIETLNAALLGAGSIHAGIDLQAAFTNVFVDRAQALMK